MSTHTSPDKGAEAERAAFEAWCAKKAYSTNKWHDGGYVDSNTQNGWEVWQAARRAPAPVADGLPPLLPNLPSLPQSLLNQISYYGMARTDGKTDDERLYLWLQLIEGIKLYAAEFGRDAIAADRQARASVPAAGAVQQPVAVGVKDHEIRELVNTLRDIAVKYYGTQQLRSQIQDVVLPMFQRAQIARQSQDETVYQYRRKGCAAWLECDADTEGLLGRQGVAHVFDFRMLHVASQAGAAPAPGNTAQPVEQVGERVAANRDKARLDFLDTNVHRFRMGWEIGAAPVGNLSVRSIIMGGRPIREAIDIAMADIKGATDGAEGEQS